MQDPVFSITLLEKTVLRYASSSNLIKIDEKRKFNKNQEEELVKALYKINQVKQNETLSKMIEHLMRHWGLQCEEKGQQKHKVNINLFKDFVKYFFSVRKSRLMVNIEGDSFVIATFYFIYCRIN